MNDNDSSDPRIAREGKPVQRRSHAPGDDEVTLMGLILTLTRGRGLIVLSVLGFGLFGLLYSFAVPAEYTSTSKVVREASDSERGSLPGGLPSISGLGISLGGGGGGLTSASYPEIASGREVRLAVARDTFYFQETGRRTTFVEYVNRSSLTGRILDYTLYLPWTIKEAIAEAMTGDARRPIRTDSTDALVYPTEKEENAIQVLETMISVTVSESSALESGTGLMSISTTASDPVLAARLNERTVKHLRTRVRQIRTEKTRENLRFTEQRLEEARRELEEAENRLSKFLERNRGVLSGGGAARLKFERDRLRREVQFKEDLYSQLQKEVTQARLKLQREQPVVTMAEKPAPPPEPSAPNRPLNVILAVLIGGLFGTAGSFFQAAVRGQEGERRREQLQEVTESWKPSGILEDVRRLLGTDKTG